METLCDLSSFIQSKHKTIGQGFGPEGFGELGHLGFEKRIRMKFIHGVISHREESKPERSLSVRRDVIWKTGQVVDQDFMTSCLRPFQPVPDDSTAVSLINQGKVFVLG